MEWPSRAALAHAAEVAGNPGRGILATGRYIGEGFDDLRLDTLYLAMPVSWRGTIAQHAGRLHPLHEGKHEMRIYDNADLDVPMLARMFERPDKVLDAVIAAPAHRQRIRCQAPRAVERP